MISLKHAKMMTSCPECSPQFEYQVYPPRRVQPCGTLILGKRPLIRRLKRHWVFHR